MKVTHLVSLFLFCLTSLAPAVAHAAPATDGSAPKDLPMHQNSTPVHADISLTRLTNGLTVAVKRDTRFPLASLRLYVHAGSAYETPDIAGISHQLEHMVFKGTDNRPKGAVATDIEKAGGYLNAATSFDYTVYLTDMPADQWKLGMEVLKDMAFHPSLDPQELESEKDVVLAELQRGLDTPARRLFNEAAASTLKGTPYERPIIGFPETIRAYTAEKMRAYIDRLYQPQSMLLLVVGDVDPDAVKQEAERLFGSIPNTQTVVPPASMTPQDFPDFGPIVTVEKTPWDKVYMSLAFPGVALNDGRAPALDVFAHLLGGDTSSYLYQTYKYEKRLVDTISVANYTFERTGLFVINVSLAADKLGAFWEAFTKSLPTLASKTFTAKELDRARLAVTDSLYRQRETIAGTASTLGYFLFLSGGEDGERTYLQQIDMVDLGAVARAAEAVLQPGRLSVNIFMPQTPNAETKGAHTSTPVPDEAWLTKMLVTAWPARGNAASGPARATAGPAREVIDLGAGHTLILQPDISMPYAAVDMAFAGGDETLRPDQQGLASLTAAVLTRGTETMDAVALEAFKNDRASSLSAASGLNSFTISMDYPARFAPDMWQLLHDTLTTATLPEAEVERARENQVAAIVAREEQPLGLAFRRLYPFLFGTHPYGFLSHGTQESVKAFTRKDVAAFWEEQSRRPWALSVCGTFDREAVIAAAQKLSAPQTGKPTTKTPVWTENKTLSVSLPGRNQAHLLLVFPTVGIGHEDEAGVTLLQNILAGQSGLLFRDLRDRQGLGYTVTAFQWNAPLAGMLMFYIGTEPDKLDAAQKGFATVVAELHKTLLPETELVRGKNQMKGDHVRSRQRMSARSAEAARLALLGRSLDAERELVDKALGLTPGDIQALVRKYLSLDKAYTVTVLPE